jgi:hypothetical protein
MLSGCAGEEISEKEGKLRLSAFFYHWSGWCGKMIKMVQHVIEGLVIDCVV